MYKHSIKGTKQSQVLQVNTDMLSDMMNSMYAGLYIICMYEHTYVYVLYVCMYVCMKYVYVNLNKTFFTVGCQTEMWYPHKHKTSEYVRIGRNYQGWNTVEYMRVVGTSNVHQ